MSKSIQKKKNKGISNKHMLVLFVSKFAEDLEAIDQTTSRILNESKILIDILKQLGIQVSDLYYTDC